MQETNYPYLCDIDELELPTRLYNALKRQGIETVYDLACVSRETLLADSNIGRKSMNELDDALESSTVVIGELIDN